jgi:hypothetical protein
MKGILNLSEVRAADNKEDGVLDFIGSTDEVVRDGSILEQSWKLTNFRKNPVFLFAHDYASLPIGKAIRVWKDKGGSPRGSLVKGERLLFRVQFVPQEISPDAWRVYQMYGADFLNAVSVGFRPERRDLTDEERREYKITNPWAQFLFNPELLELSAAPVPMDANAVKLAVKRGFAESEEDFQARMQERFEEIVGRTRVDEMRSFLDELECAIEEDEELEPEVEDDLGLERIDLDANQAPVEPTEPTPEDLFERGTLPYSNLPVASDKGIKWNASAAIKRVRAWAGISSEEDMKSASKRAKYRKAFMRINGDASNFTSYGLPFADVIDGKLQAVWRGVAAAMAAILGARGGLKGSSSERLSLYSLARRYYKKFGEEAPKFHALKSASAQIMVDVSKSDTFESFMDTLKEHTESMKAFMEAFGAFDVSPQPAPGEPAETHSDTPEGENDTSVGVADEGDDEDLVDELASFDEELDLSHEEDI